MRGKWVRKTKLPITPPSNLRFKTLKRKSSDEAAVAAAKSARSKSSQKGARARGRGRKGAAAVPVADAEGPVSGRSLGCSRRPRLGLRLVSLHERGFMRNTVCVVSYRDSWRVESKGIGDIEFRACVALGIGERSGTQRYILNFRP